MVRSLPVAKKAKKVEWGKGGGGGGGWGGGVPCTHEVINAIQESTSILASQALTGLLFYYEMFLLKKYFSISTTELLH